MHAGGHLRRGFGHGPAASQGSNPNPGEIGWTNARRACTLDKPMALHRLYTDVFMPAAAGTTSWSKGDERVSLTAIFINQQPRGY